MEPPDVLSLSDLYTSEITSTECPSKLRSLLSCPSRVTAARNLQGSDAETLINFLDRALKQLYLDDRHRQRCVRLLSKICKAQRIIPASYFLRGEFIHVGTVRGCGGFSEVSDGAYLGCPVAIKDLKANKDDSDKMFKRFCREIVAWKHLSHPNVLPLLGVFISADLQCFRIFSEWMPNGNLVQYTRSNPEANSLQLLSEVASGVTYLHELGIVHGDLKGENILVDNAGHARISDFGVMTMRNLGTLFFSESTDSLGGTLPWMSPELLDQLRPGSNPRPTPESDCYALGMVIYEILTGLPPFYGLSFLEIMLALATGGHPEKPLGAKFVGLSDELWELVRSCWSRSISIRPAAHELFEHLFRASPTWVPLSQRPELDPDTDLYLPSSSCNTPANPPNKV